MNILEYQGKKILKKFNVNIPKGICCKSIYEIIKASQKIGGKNWILKAQIYAGARGKSGGIKNANSILEIKKHAKNMLHKKIITKQTGKNGEIINSILIEKKILFKRELYFSILTNRKIQKITILISNFGGINIENISKKNSKLIHKINISPNYKINDNTLNEIIKKLKFNSFNINDIKYQIQQIYKAYWETDSTLLEINPLVITKKNKLIALDAKFNIDNNAFFKHPEFLKFQIINKNNKNEIKALKFGMSYISLEGNIGCLVNGAGLAMATMDSIKYYGGEPANFLDIGGNANKENIIQSFKIMLKNKKIKVILINIFGGIIKCDIVAKGILKALQIININIPIIIRLKGTNEDIAKKILYNNKKFKIIFTNNIKEATKKAVKLSF